MVLRDLLPRVRRIRRDGDPAAGVVTAIRDGARHRTLTLAVKLPAGQATTVRRPVATADLGDLRLELGVTLPVRYDRTRPTQVELDLDALRMRASRTSSV